MLVLTTTAHAQKAASYKPPVFTDPLRNKKIEAAIPVVEALYKAHAEKVHYPGSAFGVLVDGRLVYASGFGHTDVAKKIPATPQSAFRIASMTKSITALAIMQLRDAGKLRLDDPASAYLPELKKVAYLTTDAPPITVRHLLTHAAGFPEDNPWGDRQLADTDADLFKLVTGGVGFSNVPGLAYEYSNLGFALLGKIITNVARRPYQQYITENILKPLGMTHTYWEWKKVPPTQLAHGYRWQNEQWQEEPLEHDGAYGAMGGLITTIEDFSKYMQLHMEAWPPRSGGDSRVLKRSSLREMHHPWNIGPARRDYKFSDGRTCPYISAYSYGLNWARICADRIFIGHSGGLPGFGSQWRFLPDYGIGVVSFANLTYANTGVINAQVLDTLITLAGLTPRVLPPSPVLQQRKDALVKLLPHWNNAQASGLFAENFFLDNPIDSLRKQAAALFARAGEIKAVHQMVAENNLRGTFVLEGANASLEVFFTLTPENPPLIQEFHLRELKKE
jgi:CubicO group peptidase (beta-lactamase class C family)